MLPSKDERGTNERKYADTAIPLLLRDMEKAGARRDTITAKIMGGASMFKLIGNGMMSEIGRNNVVKVKAVLADLNIAIIAEDTGGDYGRTIDFYSADGTVKVKSIGREVKML